MAEAATMAAERVPDHGKTVTVYRNGDFNYAGRKFVLNRRVRTLDAFLGDITQGIKPQFGAVRQLYTPATGTRVDSLSQLQPNGVYVAGGTERFKLPVNTPYNGIPTKQRTRSMTTVQRLPPLNRQQKKIEPRLRQITGPKIIHVYRNGDVFSPGVRLLLDRHTLGNFEQVLARVTDRIELRTGAVRRLCNMQGSDIYGLSEIENNGRYVAVGSSETFKSLPYGNPEMLSPRRPGGNKAAKIAVSRRVPARLKPLQRKRTEAAPPHPAAPAAQNQTTEAANKRRHKPRPPAANPHRKRSVGVQPPEILLEPPSQSADKQKQADGESNSQLTPVSKTPQHQISPGIVEHPTGQIPTSESRSSLHGKSQSSLHDKSPQPVQKETVGDSHLAELANRDSMFHVQAPKKDTKDLVVTADYYTGDDRVFRSSGEHEFGVDTVAEAKDMVEERPIDLQDAEEVDEETAESDDDGLLATQSAPGQLDNIEEMLRVPQHHGNNGMTLQTATNYPQNKPLIARKVNGEEEEEEEDRDSLDEDEVEDKTEVGGERDDKTIVRSNELVDQDESLPQPLGDEAVSPPLTDENDDVEGRGLSLFEEDASERDNLHLDEDGHETHTLQEAQQSQRNQDDNDDDGSWAKADENTVTRHGRDGEEASEMPAAPKGNEDTSPGET